jgi:hypothetical protein
MSDPSNIGLACLSDPRKLGLTKCRRYGMFVRPKMLGCGMVAKPMTLGSRNPMQVYCKPRHNTL